MQYPTSLCHTPNPVGDPLQAVDELLRLLGASEQDPVPRPTWHYDDGKLPQLNGMPLREALAMCYDLRCALTSAHAVLNAVRHDVSTRSPEARMPYWRRHIAPDGRHASLEAL